MSLWPRQTAAFEQVIRAVDAGRNSGLVSLPTGAGKSRLAVTCARRLRDLYGWRTLWLTHTDELCRQAVNEFAVTWSDAKTGIVKADSDDWQGVDACIASVPTLRGRRLARVPSSQFGFVVFDEAHHIQADTWKAVHSHFNASFTLGLSATPQRHDGQGLDGIVAELYDPQEAPTTDDAATVVNGGLFVAPAEGTA